MTSPIRPIVALFWRVVTPVDFFNIERGRGAGPRTGGGQRYFDVPIGGNLNRDQFSRFFSAPPLDQDDSTWPVIERDAHSVGRVSGVSRLSFSPRRGGNDRYRIANQNRQSASSQRHPSWTQANGFPEAPNDILSKGDPRIPSLNVLKLVVAKDVDGQFFASYVNRVTMPASWPTGLGLEVLFESNDDLIRHRMSDGVIEVPPAAHLTQTDLAMAMAEATPAEEIVGVLAETLGAEMAATGQFDPATVTDARERTMASIVRRRGQPAFRSALLEAYESQCAITGCEVVDALEAAHIIGYQGAATNTPGNGLLLRADIHTLFDLRLFSIDPVAAMVVLSPRLRGTHYGWLEGRSVRFPANVALRPSTAALNQHRTEAGL